MSKVHYVSLYMYHATMVSWGLERGSKVLIIYYKRCRKHYGGSSTV
jgi:hypothetical protein